MTNWHVQSKLATASGLPEDVVINTWAFIAETGSDEDNCDLISAALTAFYQETNTITSFWLTGDVQHFFYRVIPATPLGSPFAVIGDSFTASGEQSLPLETCLCLSFAGGSGGGTISARRRGRVYIGPLGESVNDGGSPAAPRPNSSALTDLITAGATLGESVGISDINWAVWSRVDDDLVPVVRAWVDDEFDTQRRRGARATTRVTNP